MITETIAIPLSAFLIFTAAYLFYTLRKRTHKAGMAELDRQFMEVIARNVSSNLKRLERGDLAWRRLGHGQATIGLKKIAPKNGGIVTVSLAFVEERHPDIIEDIRDIDTGIIRLQDAALRLASALEEPVRRQFMEDRNRLPGQSSPEILHFRKWLLDREDGWMEILANIINNGQTLTRKNDPAALYWQYAAETYMFIANKYAAHELRDIEHLRNSMTDRSQRILEKLEENL